MKYMIRSLSVALFIHLFLFATPLLAKTVINTNQDEQALLKLNEKWLNALPIRDVNTIGNLLADDFVSIDPQTGKSRTKAQVLESIKSSNVELKEFRYDEVEIRIFGDTAFVTGVTKFIRVSDGIETNAMNRYLDIYIKRKGKWLAIGAQVTRLQNPTK